MRGATSRRLLSGQAGQFQSTHPMRGATYLNWMVLPDFFDFNPRTPCGVRLTRRYCKYRIAQFQSTHPMRGATLQNQRLLDAQGISIHAPHAGCDMTDMATGCCASENFNPRTPCGVRQIRLMFRCFLADFNPRTPCGVRRRFLPSICTKCLFQSTHPMRGATDLIPFLNSLKEFQSTHPMRGATRESGCTISDKPDFNPRTPCGVRRGRCC